MRKLRAVLAGAVTVGVLGATGSTGPALAATAGVGTSQVSTSLVQVSLGDDGSVLSVRVLGDDSQSTIDPAVSAPSASTRLVPLDVSSTAVPALNVSLPAVESKSSGPQSVQSSPVIDLTTAATGGSISPFSIVSQVDSGKAHSLLDTSASDLTVAGGLLSVPSAVSALRTTAATDESEALRGIQVPNVTVLDLSAVLEGLGVKLTDLPIETLTSLLSSLGVEVPGVGSGEDVQAAVDDLNAAIDDVQALLDAGSGTVGTVDEVLDLLGPVSDLVDTAPIEEIVGDGTAAANAAIDELQGTLGTLLTDLLTTLDGVALLEVNGVDIGIATVATDTVAGSSAGVTAELGGLSVGNIDLPGVDLAATAADLAAAVEGLESTVDGVLDDVHPDLAGLLDVALFEKTSAVTTDQKYVTAAAGITAVVARIAPPADLVALVGEILAGTGVDETLADLGLLASSSGGVQAASVLDGATPMAALNDAVGVDALASGAEVRVLDFSATSRFAPQAGVNPPAAPAAPGAPGELPRTGTGMPLALLGAVLLASSLMLVRWLRTPSTVR